MSDQVEPSAALRGGAHQLRELYVALVAEGFTSQEALEIIGHILAVGQGTP